MKSLLKSEVVMVAWRIVLLYVVLTLCQTIFYLYNQSLIEGLTIQEIAHLFPGALKFDAPSILYTNALWIVLSLIPLRLRAKTWYKRGLFWLYMVTNTVAIIAINFADVVYFRYTQKRISMEELLFADNDNSVELMGQFALENWWLIIIMIAMVYLLAKAYMLRVESPSTPKSSWLYYPTHTAILLVAAFFVLSGVRGGFPSSDTRPIAPSNATIYTTDIAKVNLILSNPFCIIRSIGHTAPRNVKFFDKAKADSLFTPFHYPAKYIQDSLVKYKGYNVMVVIMESFSAENSAFLAPHLYEAGDKGYMPFLDSLMRNGLALKQMHANGTRSIQAMPSVLGSMPSLTETFVLMPQSMGESRHMPKILRDIGYTTSFFCGSSRHSMGFAAYATMAGVEHLRSREDYEKKHGKKDFDDNWGIWDEPFLQFMGEELTEMQEPFMASVFTLTAHHPFSIPAEYKDILPKGKTRIQPGTAYDDMAIGKFFERFSKEEWFNRTIFVFTADHVSSEKMAPETRHYPGNHHIVGFIYTPDGSLQAEINDVTQQIDIMPTILGLLGNKEPYFAFGRDILNEPERPNWSMVYNGDFKANTNDGVVTINESETLKAAVQQYYDHIEKRSYVVE
ncbi:MAG: sulfatase-like hydrolase/transferase [Rikenellaceae bacterium]